MCINFHKIHLVPTDNILKYIWYRTWALILCKQWRPNQPAQPQLAFYVNLHRAVIGPSATLTGRWRPDIDLRRMLTGSFSLFVAILYSILWPCKSATKIHDQTVLLDLYLRCLYVIRTPSPVSILRKSISGRHRPVRVADGPMTARCRFT